MTDQRQAALYRFGAILLCLAAGAAISTWVPDPALKGAGAGLAIAAILAGEQYLKTAGAPAGTTATQDALPALVAAALAATSVTTTTTTAQPEPEPPGPPPARVATPAAPPASEAAPPAS